MPYPIPPYGTAIQEAVASGDLTRMKKVAAEAEKYVRETGKLTDALKMLKKEIATLEARSRKR